MPNVILEHSGNIRRSLRSKGEFDPFVSFRLASCLQLVCLLTIPTYLPTYIGACCLLLAPELGGLVI